MAFQFRDDITIDYGNAKFTVPNTDEFMKKCKDVSDRFHGRPHNDEKAAINEILDYIDELLGDGATGKIFEGHKLVLENVYGAFLYIYEEVAKFKNNYVKIIEEKAKQYNAVQLGKVQTDFHNMGITPAAPSKAELAIASVAAAARPRL